MISIICGFLPRNKACQCPLEFPPQVLVGILPQYSRFKCYRIFSENCHIFSPEALSINHCQVDKTALRHGSLHCVPRALLRVHAGWGPGISVFIHTLQVSKPFKILKNPLLRMPMINIFMLPGPTLFAFT